MLACELYLHLHLNNLCIYGDISIKYLSLLIDAPEALILVSTVSISCVDFAYIVHI